MNNAKMNKSTLIAMATLFAILAMLIGFGVTYASFEPSDTPKDSGGTDLVIRTGGSRS